MNDYRIDGDVATVFLTPITDKPSHFLVDAADLPRVLSVPRRWIAAFMGGVRKRPYVITRDGHRDKQTTTLLHRFLLTAPSSVIVDHINGDTMDNRRGNLRICTKSQNAQNMHVVRAQSGHKNVYPQKRSGKWYVCVTVNRKQHYSRLFTDVNDAVAEAVRMRRQLHTHCPENSIQECK